MQRIYHGLFLILSSAQVYAEGWNPQAAPKPPAIIHQQTIKTSLPTKPLGIAAAVDSELYDIGNPTDEEQHYLELINRARANPTQEGIFLATNTDSSVLASIQQYGVNLTMMKAEFALLPARMPLAFNKELSVAARLHNQYQFDQALQTHDSANGDGITKRATAAGYDWSSIGENVFSYATNSIHGHIGFQIDWGPPSASGDTDGMQNPRGHRDNIHADFREIGIGVINGTNTVEGRTVGSQLVTQNFGTNNYDEAFVTGVAYHDLNGNSFYDPGEGIGGLTVTVEGADFHAVTSNSGGYTIPITTENSTRAVRFEGLGADFSTSAVIANQENEKVDFTPAYTAPTLTGASVFESLTEASYNFPTVIGATSYEGRRVLNVNAAMDAADDLNRVTVVTGGSYNALSTSVQDSGTGAYHLLSGSANDQTLTYNARFYVKSAASLTFRSRLRTATSNQFAKVQISDNDGASWVSVYSQAGNGADQESNFQSLSVSLASYAGKEIRVRFSYSVTGRYFTQTTDNYGWYIDNINFTNLVDLTNAVITTAEAGVYAFTPPAAGDYMLAVRPIVSEHRYTFGPAKLVTATAGPPSLAEIVIEQPEDSALTDGSSTVNFGTQFLTQPEARLFTIRNAGTETLNLASATVTGTNAADFVAGTFGAATLAPEAETTLTVTFTPSAKGARSAVLQILSNDADEGTFDIILTGTGTNSPSITQKPLPLIVSESQQVMFSVVAVHPTISPLRYQWRKNGIAIKNATLSTYSISQAKLTDAAAYSVLVTAGTEFTESELVPLIVYQPVTQSWVLKKGSKATLTTNVSGTGHTLIWKKISGNPPVTETLTTTPNQKSLVLSTISDAAHTALYTCEILLGQTTVPAGSFDLKVFETKTIITSGQAMPDGQIGRDYFHQIKLDGGVSSMATSYGSGTLPSGLKLDAKTGIISGKPTVAKEYTIALKAGNSFGSTVTTDTILISPLPDNVAGVYTGKVNPSQLNSDLGGRVDFTISTKGSISGSIDLGGSKHSFTGVVDISTEEPQGAPEATVTIKRSKTTPVTLTFTLDVPGNRFATASVRDDLNTATIEGWRQIWRATGTPLNLATPEPKIYTFGLSASGEDDMLPQGHGYGSFSLAKDGKLTITGLTADGTSYTCGTFAGPLGEVLLYQAIYAPKGSLCGVLDLDQADSGNLNSNLLTGSALWYRPSNPSKTALVYKAGFGPATITASGAHYTPPTNSAMMLGIVTPDVDKARLIFTGGALDVASPNVEFDVGVGNKIKIPKTLGAPKITKFSTSTGIFTGTFEVEDNDPRAAFAGKKVKRGGTFSGILTQQEDRQIGTGHFMLPELPRDANPVAEPPITATTPKTSAKVSGAVLMEKVPLE